MNGKIEISLGGHKRHLWFNNYAKGSLGGLYGLDPLEAGDKLITQMQANYMRAIADLVYCGLEGHHEATDTSKDYTKKEILLWCAEMSEEDAVKVFNTWLHASQLREIVKTEVKEEKEEKKRRGKKSLTSRSVNSA